MNLPKHHLLFTTLASLPLLLLLSCSKQPAAPSQSIAPPQSSPPPPAVPAADASTPKKAALALANAMVAGDTGAMRSLSVGTNGQVFAFYTALAEMVGAQRKFKAVLTAKFGDADGLPPEIEAIGAINPLPPGGDSWNEKIDGDSAMLADASGHSGLKFKKVDGNWKVDFTAADATLPPGGSENMAKQQEIFVSTKKAFDMATQKIIDGSCNDPKAAVDEVMSVIKPAP